MYGTSSLSSLSLSLALVLFPNCRCARSHHPQAKPEGDAAEGAGSMSVGPDTDETLNSMEHA